MKYYFATTFDVRHERSLILFSTLTDSNILNQTIIMDY